MGKEISRTGMSLFGIATIIMGWVALRTGIDLVQSFFGEPDYIVELHKIRDQEALLRASEKPEDIPPWLDSSVKVRRRYRSKEEEALTVATPEQVAAYHEKYDIPTKLSQFVNTFVPFFGKRDPRSWFRQEIFLYVFFAWLCIAVTTCSDLVGKWWQEFDSKSRLGEIRPLRSFFSEFTGKNHFALWAIGGVAAYLLYRLTARVWRKTRCASP